METATTWRELLGIIVADPLVRQRMANDMDVIARTLSDWSAGKKDPHQANLYKMLNAIPPQYRVRMVHLLKKEYTSFEDVPPEYRQQEGVPTEFVERVMEMYCRFAGSLRREAICNFILNRASEHLDPEQRFMHVRICVCNPPSLGGKVRSLFLEQGRMATQLREDMPHLLLLGAESVTAYAVVSLQPLYIADRKSEHRVTVTVIDERDRSLFACPIQREGRVAGVFVAIAREPYYFTTQKQHLFRQYTDLLSLAFRDNEFYDKSEIALAKMPPKEVQERDYARYGDRIVQVVTATGKTLIEAERYVREELERGYIRFMTESVIVSDEQNG
ncbi:MAG: hypothetical protein NVS9B9_03250 [Ktedonobacteraceae bacterium]